MSGRVFRTIVKILVIQYILIGVTEISKAQQKDPFYFAAKYTGDFVSINEPNSKYMSCYLGNIDFAFSLNTEAAGLWKGGRLYTYILNNHGSRPTRDYVGDLQGFSNIEAPSRTKLFELYYSQKFNSFSFKIGQINLNDEYVYSSCGRNYINSSFGVIPTVSQNIPVSIFPNSAPGITAKLNISPALAIQAAFFDGFPGDETDNYYGIHWTHDNDEGFVMVGEVHYSFMKDSALLGKYKLGGWYHSATFTNLTDTSHTYKGNQGIYFIADQMIIPEKQDATQGLGIFVQLGYSPELSNNIVLAAGGGICYTGLFANHSADVVGLAFSNATINSPVARKFGLAKAENVVELTYSINFTNHFAIQPNVQYILNSGAAKQNNDFFIALVRVAILI